MPLRRSTATRHAVSLGPAASPMVPLLQANAGRRSVSLCVCNVARAASQACCILAFLRARRV